MQKGIKPVSYEAGRSLERINNALDLGSSPWGIIKVNVSGLLCISETNKQSWAGFLSSLFFILLERRILLGAMATSSLGITAVAVTVLQTVGSGCPAPGSSAPAGSPGSLQPRWEAEPYELEPLVGLLQALLQTASWGEVFIYILYKYINIYIFSQAVFIFSSKKLTEFLLQTHSKTFESHPSELFLPCSRILVYCTLLDIMRISVKMTIKEAACFEVVLCTHWGSFKCHFSGS